MKPKTALGVLILAVGIFVGSAFLEAWVLGIILSWFGVSLTFWQNLLIILLANAIFKNSGVSSK
jgi:hypothetical protein